jgi:hypothetical protein
MIIKTKKYFTNLINFKNNKYYVAIKNIINTFLFLKYLLLISVIVFSIYLIIPKTFDLSKKKEIITRSLLSNYSIELTKYSKISYSIFPTPRIIIEKTSLNFKDNNGYAETNSLTLIIKLTELYRNQNLNIKVIKLDNSVINVEINKLKKLLNNINKIKKTILIKNSALIIKNDKEKLVKISNVNFNNYKNDLRLKGLLNGEKIEFKFLNKFEDKKLFMIVPSMGANINIIFDKESNLKSYGGSLESKILGNIIKFKFKKDKVFEIFKSYFSNSKINTSFNGIIKLSPYFDFNINLDIKNLKNVSNLLSGYSNYYFKGLSNINSVTNGKLKITFNENKFKNNFLESVKILFIFENGNINIDDSLFEFNNGSFTIKGTTTNYGNFKRFNFEILSNILNRRTFFKKFGLPSSDNTKPLEILAKGSLNLSSNKINFTKISVNKDYVASEDDKNYFKNVIETLIINNNILNLFKLKNIKIFAQKIYQ